MGYWFFKYDLPAHSRDCGTRINFSSMEAEDSLSESSWFSERPHLVQYCGLWWCELKFFFFCLMLRFKWMCFYFAALIQPSHCSVCEKILLAGGMLCDSCGICVDSVCMKKANKKINCKPVSLESTSMKHHWVKGWWIQHPTLSSCTWKIATIKIW